MIVLETKNLRSNRGDSNLELGVGYKITGFHNFSSIVPTTIIVFLRKTNSNPISIFGDFYGTIISNLNGQRPIKDVFSLDNIDLSTLEDAPGGTMLELFSTQLRLYRSNGIKGSVAAEYLFEIHPRDGGTFLYFHNAGASESIAYPLTIPEAFDGYFSFDPSELPSLPKYTQLPPDNNPNAKIEFKVQNMYHNIAPTKIELSVTTRKEEKAGYPICQQHTDVISINVPAEDEYITNIIQIPYERNFLTSIMTVTFNMRLIKNIYLPQSKELISTHDIYVKLPENHYPSIDSNDIVITPNPKFKQAYEDLGLLTSNMSFDIKTNTNSPTFKVSTGSLSDYYNYGVNVTFALENSTPYQMAFPPAKLGNTSLIDISAKNSGDRCTSIYAVGELTDSRELKASAQSETHNIYPYRFPQIMNFSVIRADFTRPQEGILLDTGNSIRINLDIRIDSINNKNNKLYTIEYAKSTNGDLAIEEVWIKLVDIPPLTSYDSSLTIDVDSSKADSTGKTHIFDQKSQYKFRVSVTDYFETVKAETTVESEYVLLDFHASGTGIALGKIADKENTLDVDMNMILGGFNMNISSATVSLYESLGMQVFPEEIPMAEEYPTTFELLEKKEKK